MTHHTLNSLDYMVVSFQTTILRLVHAEVFKDVYLRAVHVYSLFARVPETARNCPHTNTFNVHRIYESGA
jgi:hypothetical protein